jgi:hypothetical protein
MKKSILITCISLIALAGCNRSKIDSVQAAENPTGAVPVASSDPSAAPPEASAPRTSAAMLPAGTNFRVRLQGALDTRSNRAGDKFTAVLDEPLVSGERVVVPKGTIFTGHVTRSTPSGRFKGRAVLAVQLDSFSQNGQTYVIRSTNSSRASHSHKKHNWAWIGGGSGGGAAIGAIAGGGSGALIGAGAGAAAGTVGSAITGKRQVHLPAEYSLRFSLVEPITLG